jgi:hypothetical protein
MGRLIAGREGRGKHCGCDAAVAPGGGGFASHVFVVGLSRVMVIVELEYVKDRGETAAAGFDGA